MKSVKKLLLLTLIALSAFNVEGQVRNVTNNNLFWSEIVFAGSIKNKFAYSTDLQYRRRAFGSGNTTATDADHSNLFKVPFQYVIRPWLHYSYSPKLKFSLSPLGLWFNFKEDSPKAGFPTTFQPELRICAQATFNDDYGRVNITQRFRYEYRMFGNKVPINGGDFDVFDGYSFNDPGFQPKQRIRTFLRANIPLQSNSMKELLPHQFYISILDEMFINAGKNAGNNIFDQNRFLTSLGYKVCPDVRIELGYLNQLAFQNVGKTGVQDVYRNDVLQFYLFFDNFNKFFKKSEVKEEKKEAPKDLK
jgi:hypothetical protein